MADNIQYDPAALQEMAETLYRRGRMVLIFWPLFGAMIGGYVGYGFGSIAGAGIGAAAGTLLGYMFGSLRSMSSKLQAQTALCQKQIEANTSKK